LRLYAVFTRILATLRVPTTLKNAEFIFGLLFNPRNSPFTPAKAEFTIEIGLREKQKTTALAPIAVEILF